MPSYPKAHRLRSKQDFQQMYQRSFRIFGDFFVLRLCPGPGHARLGVMVSKKFGNSPYRNMLRRILRELFRLRPPALPLDLHISQIRPFSKRVKAKKELQRFFNILQDAAFLKMHQFQEGSLALKDIRPSEPMSPAAQAAFYAVLFYKKYLSPKIKPSCRFTPSCSEYAMDSFRVYGFFKGLVLALGRIFRCHPLGKTGYDPIPKKRNTANKK